MSTVIFQCCTGNLAGCCNIFTFTRIHNQVFALPPPIEAIRCQTLAATSKRIASLGEGVPPLRSPPTSSSAPANHSWSALTPRPSHTGSPVTRARTSLSHCLCCGLCLPGPAARWKSAVKRKWLAGVASGPGQGCDSASVQCARHTIPGSRADPLLW